MEKYFELRDKIIEENYKHLNEEQRQAVLTTKGPLLMIAGAGSGKTTALTNRVAHLLKFGDIYKSSHVPSDMKDSDFEFLESCLENGIDSDYYKSEDIARLLNFRGIEPWSFLAITFTNKAAEEMKSRVEKLGNFYGELWVSTFHSACVRILRRHADCIGYKKNFTIYDTTDKKAVIKECLAELDLDPKKNPPNAMANEISNAKNKLLGPEKYRKAAYDYFQEIVASVYSRYQEKLWKNNALDFDDLIMCAVELLEANEDILEFYQNKFRYIMVDEYQDTNYAQYKFIRKLAEKNRNICVVGDPDQGIYGWRGADIKNILDFEKDYSDANIIKLEQNYRSTKTILESANEVIKQNTERKEKTLWTDNPEGELLKVYRCENEHGEAGFVMEEIKRLKKEENRSLKDFAVFYRTNAQSRVLEEGLLKNNIPYEIIGGQKFYERKEIKDIIAYLRIISNPDDDISFSRIINTPKRSIGDRSLGILQEYAEENDISSFQALNYLNGISGMGAKARKSMENFIAIMDNFRNKLEKLSVTELTIGLLEETGYISKLQEEKTPEAEARIENLQEFLSVTEEYDRNGEEGTLDDFLSNLALVTDIDQYQEELEKIPLMTMHAAKGLEFPVVFICGMEEGVFPHHSALTVESELQEERRLCHVAMTRAKEKLYMVNVVQRTIYGTTKVNPPSRFIREIPESMLDDLSKGQYSGKKEEAVVEDKKSYDFIVGDTVLHPKWGTGTIVQKKSEQVSVAFPNTGIKHLSLEYAPLKKA